MVVGIIVGVFVIAFIISKIVKGSHEPVPADAHTLPADAVQTPEMIMTEESGTDDSELIAVLTAAIAASLNTSTYNLHIKSYRQINNNSPAWNQLSRRENLLSRL